MHPLIMGRRHWLDPLARQILKFSGQLSLKRDVKTSISKVESIEEELLKIKQKYSDKQNDLFLFIDINKATAEELRKLPGCNERMVELLIRLQRGGVQLSSTDDLVKILNIPTSLAEEWSSLIVFRWYGDGEISKGKTLLDINQASYRAIKEKLDWPDSRLRNLIRGRQKKPFENLADLQERLILAPSVIEDLIGVVCFSPKKAGPSLPHKR